MCQSMNDDEWDILAKAFDEYIAQLTEDGIPLWMIEERLRLEQLHTQKPKADEKNDSDNCSGNNNSDELFSGTE